MPTRPIERPDGQDDRPDVATALHATIVLLDDVRDRLAARTEDADLLLRVIAVRSALRRLRKHMRDEEG